MSSSAPRTTGGAPDLVLTNGAVYTVDATERWAQAVAVGGGRILAVGTDADVRDLIGAGTQVIDLRGRMVLPGFQDGHVHAGAAGLDRLRCDLSPLHSADGYLKAIRGYADAQPDADWIVGGGWAMDVFPGGTPSAVELDRAIPDRPVFLSNRDNHAAWVNSRALELAGIDGATLDPSDGRIEREEGGSPQGTLHEGAMTLVRRIMPSTSAQDIERAILIAQDYLHSLGITAWQDAIVGEYPTMPDTRDAYPALVGRGKLTARVVGALWWERGRGVEQVDDRIAERERSTDRYRATSVKIMLDGVCENRTACMLDPYLDPGGEPTDGRGLSYVDPAELPGVLTRLDAEGFQVHIHVIGDGAVRAALDAIEAARNANGSSDHRHHLAHIQVVHPDDLPRFRQLGVVANGQPLWAANDPQMTELTLPVLGPERSTWQYPFGSLLRSGAVLAFGSDWPVSSPDPIEEIHTAVNRTTAPGYAYGGDDPRQLEPFLPAERLTLSQAIRAFTMGSAYVNHLETQTGSIEVGKLADLVVLSENLFALDPGELTSARVLLTLVDGRPVYESPDL
jgi:predicted amidohydrolase YtcJ